MAEAQSQPFDLSTYNYDPSCPLPSNREARNRVIAKDPCQPTDGTFPKNNSGRRFLTSCRMKNSNGLNTLGKQTKVFAFSDAHSIVR